MLRRVRHYGLKSQIWNAVMGVDFMEMLNGKVSLLFFLIESWNFKACKFSHVISDLVTGLPATSSCRASPKEHLRQIL